MILTGLARLGRDAVLRYMADGTPVVNLALAYNYGQKAADGKRPAQWVEASLWGKRAEALAPHLLKGTALDVVLDEVRLDEWVRQDGTPGKPKLVGRVINVEFAGRAPERESGQPAPSAASAPAQAAPSDSGTATDVFDPNDIPF